jgi:ArsR family metal-binding transcriptional regulator
MAWYPYGSEGWEMEAENYYRVIAINPNDTHSLMALTRTTKEAKELINRIEDSWQKALYKGVYIEKIEDKNKVEQDIAYREAARRWIIKHQPKPEPLSRPNIFKRKH